MRLDVIMPWMHNSQNTLLTRKISTRTEMIHNNEEKMSPASIGGASKAQITGGEHISRLVETPTEVVLPVAKPERRRYNGRGIEWAR